MRILLAEDDPLLGDGLRAGLRQRGWQVDWVRDGEAAERELKAEPYAAAVLDLGLPQLDGSSVLQRWRAAGKAMPVLILTARDSWTDKVAGIDAGADDVVNDDGTWRVMSEPSIAYELKEALEAAGFTVDSADTPMFSENLVPVTSVEDARKVLRIMEAMEDNDDVQDVYSNFDIADDVMEAAAG